jgi:hypothetical protein
MAREPDEQYSEQEAQRRFLGTLNAALNTPPKPLKSMTPKGTAAQRKSKSVRRSPKK